MALNLWETETRVIPMTEENVAKLAGVPPTLIARAPVEAAEPREHEDDGFGQKTEAQIRARGILIGVTFTGAAISICVLGTAFGVFLSRVLAS